MNSFTSFYNIIYCRSKCNPIYTCIKTYLAHITCVQLKIIIRLNFFIFSGAVRSVTVCAEVTTEIEGCKTKVVVWPKYGLKLTIPSDALSDGVTYTLAIKTITSQEFDIPLDSEVVSAFYWIYSSHRFIKPVTLELQHCARIDNEEVASCMSFIVARCNQEKLPYQFKKKEGVFIPHKTTGNISVISFSIFAIIKMVALSCGMTMNMLEEPVAAHIHQHKPTRYSYQYKVFGRKCNPKVYQFDFLFYKDLPPFISVCEADLHLSACESNACNNSL